MGMNEIPCAERVLGTCKIVAALAEAREDFAAMERAGAEQARRTDENLAELAKLRALCERLRERIKDDKDDARYSVVEQRWADRNESDGVPYGTF